MKKTFIISSLIAALFATPSFAVPTELDKKTVASKAYVDTKQDKIPAAEYSQSVLTDTDEDGVIGKRAILDWQTFDSNFGREDLYSEPMLANMIPEVKIVGEATRRLNWISATYTPAINAYSTTIGTGTNQWEDGDSLIDGYFLANSLALKQNKIPAGTAGNVVTYSGTAGTVGSVATANAPTYNETTGVLENGTNIATIAAVDTRQKKMTCAGWDSETHTDEHCWLWSIEE